MDAIVVTELVKDYGPVRAVDDVSFTVRAGEIFALLGPNGAGKTTAVEILEGHRHRTSGSVRVLGFDPATGGREYRERIGIVLQSAGLEEDFTVRRAGRAVSRDLPAAAGRRRRHRDRRIEREMQRQGEDAVRRAVSTAGSGARAGRRP